MFDKNNAFQSILIIDEDLRKYFSKVDIAEGYLFWGKKKVYFADSRYFYALCEKLKGSDIECREYIDQNSLLNYLKEQGVTQLSLDFTTTTIDLYLLFKEVIGDVRNGKEFLDIAQSVKDENELLNIKKACEICQKAYHSQIKTLRIGQTEIEFRDKLISRMKKLGADGVSFDLIVAFGNNSAVPHHKTGKTKLEKDMPVLVDMGCKVNGYCSDMTRMAYVGKPTEKFLHTYDAVLNANLLAEKKIKSNMTGKVADTFARDYIKSYGLDKYFTHSLGHGIGLKIHEYPRLSPKSNAILTDGMVFSIEPGVYFDGEFGIRIEDTVTLLNGKVKRLFTDKKNLIILENI